VKGEYFIVLGAVLFAPLLLSFDRKLGLYQTPGALVKAIVVVCLPFWVWDIAATARGHWSFNPDYVVGACFLGLPVEEWLFFVVVGFVSIFSWESTKYLLRRRG
jgi:lycopene cyclase domain-containing protein